jgi:hypothetical protein
MLLDALMVGSWLSLTVYTFWYLFKAETLQPLTLDDLALTWRFHKQQTGCIASRLNSLITKDDEIVGFKCDCGYEFQQKRLISQAVPRLQTPLKDADNFISRQGEKAP